MVCYSLNLAFLGSPVLVSVVSGEYLAPPLQLGM